MWSALRSGAPAPVFPSRLGIAALALGLGLLAANPAQAAGSRLAEAASQACTAQGLQPGTSEYDKCYQEQLILISGRFADSIHGSP